MATAASSTRGVTRALLHPQMTSTGGRCGSLWMPRAQRTDHVVVAMHIKPIRRRRFRIQAWVVDLVEEMLERTGHVADVRRCPQEETVRFQHVDHRRGQRRSDNRFHALDLFCTGAVDDGLQQFLQRRRTGVVNDEKAAGGWRVGHMGTVATRSPGAAGSCRLRRCRGVHAPREPNATATSALNGCGVPIVTPDRPSTNPQRADPVASIGARPAAICVVAAVSGIAWVWSWYTMYVEIHRWK